MVDKDAGLARVLALEAHIGKLEDKVAVAVLEVCEHPAPDRPAGGWIYLEARLRVGDVNAAYVITAQRSAHTEGATLPVVVTLISEIEIPGWQGRWWWRRRRHRLGWGARRRWWWRRVRRSWRRRRRVLAWFDGWRRRREEAERKLLHSTHVNQLDRLRVDAAFCDSRTVGHALGAKLGVVESEEAAPRGAERLFLQGDKVDIPVHVEAVHNEARRWRRAVNREAVADDERRTAGAVERLDHALVVHSGLARW